jgi:hypothetical protein
MATKLVSMKVDRSSAEEKTEAASMAVDQPAYPYGLSINLDEDGLEKLGLSADDLKVGDTKMLIAKVEVTSVSSNETKGGGKSESVCLQITDCCLEEAPSGKSAAASLYNAAGE